MRKPIQCSPFFLRNKIELTREVPIVEFENILRTESRMPVLLESSERIVSATYNHFRRDDSNLTELNQALLDKDCVVSPMIYESVTGNLDSILNETSLYSRLEGRLTPLLEESKKLRTLTEFTYLLTDKIIVEARNAKNALNRRIY